MSEQRYWIYDVIQQHIKDGYTGKLTLNFFKGGCSNINKEESIKAPEDAKRNQQEVHSVQRSM